MIMMKYLGYAARVDFDQEDRIFVGRVAGIDDIVVFHGNSAVAMTSKIEGKSINQWAAEVLGKAAHVS
ncbi:MAG TPA: hypothetical protein DE045_07090 [Oceanospirillaceae bacterium]|nr:hypothetical protein [Oceanospirillaceae bacterium]